MGEGRTDDHNAGSVDGRVTISEAATLLGVHKNTIRNRIKDGTYKAEKIVTERGPTWAIERESLFTNLPTNTIPSDSQEVVNVQAMEFVQDLLRPFVEDLGRVREELGAERTRREQAERERDEARRRLEELQRPPEAPETSTGESEGVEGQETGEGAQEAVETPRGGRMKPTTFAFILALLGVLVALAAAVYGRFFM